MAGISKAEREARAAAAAAASQQGETMDTDHGGEGQVEGAGESEAEGAPPTEAAQDQAPPSPQTVPMVRDRDAYPEPHTADVHPDEVSNYSAAGWTLATA